MTESIKNPRAVLYGKIALITAAVSRIPKNGHNKFFNYDYATESDITDALRELMNENGLAFLPPSVISWERGESVKKDGTRGDDLTRVQMQFELACTETGEVFTSMFWGEGQDGGDKGFYKAYTGAVKYFLMKTFLIATGDDPEQDAHQPQNRASSYVAPARQPVPAAAKPTPAAPTNGGAPFCTVHKKPMRQNEKTGNFYCATKLDDGSWCKERPVKPAPRTLPDDWEAEYDAIDAAGQ